MLPNFLLSGEMSFSPRGNLLALLVWNRVDPNNPGMVTIFSKKQRTLVPVAHARLEFFLAGDLAFSPNGRRLAVSGAGVFGDDVGMWRVNQTTGALHAVPGSPFRAGATPESLAFSPHGGLLAVVNDDDQDFVVFSVSKRTGRLRRVPGKPFGQGPDSPVSGANSVAFSPRGNLLLYGFGDEPPGGESKDSEKVAIFSTASCADPDHDGDCDS